MEIPHEADEVITLVPNKCKNCPLLEQCQKNEKTFTWSEKRYEVNVVIKTIVTEPQKIKVKNSLCNESPKGIIGEFTSNLRTYVQYGDSFSVLARMLNTFVAVSYNRIATIINSLTGVNFSEGTLTSMVSRCSKKLEIVHNQIKVNSKGIKYYILMKQVWAEGKLDWVHNSSSDIYTYLTINWKRGLNGIQANGVLTDFKGVAIQDFGLHIICLNI